MVEREFIESKFGVINLEKKYEDNPIFDIIANMAETKEDVLQWEYLIKAVYAFMYTFNVDILNDFDESYRTVSTWIWNTKLLHLSNTLHRNEGLVWGDDIVISYTHKTDGVVSTVPMNVSPEVLKEYNKKFNNVDDAKAVLFNLVCSGVAEKPFEERKIKHVALYLKPDGKASMKHWVK